ncbi:MAG TPA: T9SS type A sorting domain-containing protein [Chitinophagales bacterium]|nr:T9SS type A sorting domain-containing protein [Chitinophagales bacterium]
MKHALTFILLMLCTAVVSAQYCGHSGNPSGSGQCTPTGLPYQGFENSDSVEPIIVAYTSSTVIEFRNYDTIYIQNWPIFIQWLQIDSIGNLPDGLCWSTNKPDNRFSPGETGCIKINGKTCEPLGQYCLRIIVTISLGAPTISDGPEPIRFFLRLKNQNDAITPVDTTQTFTNSFIPYSGAPLCEDIIESILPASEQITAITITPNPFNSITTIEFYSHTTGRFTQTITNALGGEVYRHDVDIVAGENRLTIEAGNLPAGMYFYTISNGSNQITRKIIVE